jgi:hypothetical protein
MMMAMSGLSRRSFIRLGTIPLLGLGWQQVLQQRIASAAIENSKAKSCILIWLDGGPSHLETFDPKPEAPAEIRGPFRSISTKLDGLSISELMPRTAAIADRCCIIRSMTSPLGEHNIANHYMLTGYQPTPSLTYPSYGSVVSHLNRSPTQLPSYIALQEYRPTAGAGFLGSRFEPFLVPRDPRSGKIAPRDLTFYPGLDEKRLKRRRRFIEQLETLEDRLQETSLPGKSSEMSLVTDDKSLLHQAYEVILNPATRNAFQWESEPESIRSLYGEHTLGQCCLLARRLVERNVPFINIQNNDWDTHADLVLRLKQGYAGAKEGVGLIPNLDKALAALISDLSQRGLLEQTLVIVMGEFGRTPKINTTGGRDHWPRVFSVFMAGGGTKAGYVHGASDRTGESPQEGAVTPADLACTIYRLLGISPETRLQTSDGRPISVNSTGRCITEIIA